MVLSAASRLRTAAETRVPCAPVRDLLGVTDIGLAYRVQQHLTDQRVAAGVQIVGRKIGLTSAAVQKQLGVDQPDFGVLFEDMVCGEDGAVASARLMQPKAEAEIAFILAEDLDDDQLDVHRARDAISYAVAALEIVDSRVRDWDICITDTVA